jgi:hypothetical protein
MENTDPKEPAAPPCTRCEGPTSMTSNLDPPTGRTFHIFRCQCGVGRQRRARDRAALHGSSQRLGEERDNECKGALSNHAELPAEPGLGVNPQVKFLKRAKRLVGI